MKYVAVIGKNDIGNKGDRMVEMAVGNKAFINSLKGLYVESKRLA